jgi:hypothetical protein
VRYRFTQRENHEDLASGRVLRSAPGRPAFPARLASEMFQQAVHDLGRTGGLTVLDPLAGVGYLLTVVGLLHGDGIRRLLAVDVDAGVLDLGLANLALTSPSGIDSRIAELRAMADRFDREVHADAVASAERLRAQVRGCEHRFVTADSLDAGSLATAIGEAKADVVLTDVPYGEQSTWSDGTGDPVARLLHAVRRVTADDAVVALSMPKAVRVSAVDGWAHVRHGVLGHRRLVYLRAS